MSQEEKMEEAAMEKDILINAADAAADDLSEEMTSEMNAEKEMKLPRPADFTSPEELYQELIDTVKRYHPSDDISMIEKAYQIAKDAHKDQMRKSGEPYIIHPLNVALILAELELDKESIIAGLLHDVVEDTVMSIDDVRQEFGEEVALLVDGVTKLTQINWGMDKESIQAENLRKMFLAMAKDIRVILVKLADRLHNMRTSQYWKESTRQEKAKETMEIFSPVASRLGISKIKVELDDLSLGILHPEVSDELGKRIAMDHESREKFIADTKAEIAQQLEKEGIHAEISGRVKHLFSIYRKMVKQNKTFDQIYDVFAIRILVDTVKDCYAALGAVHEMYKPIPGRFKDYIAMPKPNMYQSLHTTVIGEGGQPFEIQIRTFEMHRTSEYGIAAHWKYKEKGSTAANQDAEEAKLAWLRQILEWQTSDNKEFMHLLKDDLNLFAGNVYCFTPNGDVKTLPNGSNPIDFAYSIHSAVGNKMVGARVNGKLVPIDYELKNGDRVEIITSQNSKGPSRDWLKIVKSSQAKTKINQWYKAENKDDNIQRGKDLIAAYCKAKGINLTDITKSKYMNSALEKYRYRDWDSLLAAIGHGGLKEGQIINKLLDEYKRDNASKLSDAEVLRQVAENEKLHVDKVQKPSSGIVVKGLHDLTVRFSKCCNPVPGDEIVGFITRGRGISIHRTDCANILNLQEAERGRLMPADWADSVKKEHGKYSTEIQLYCQNRIGLFADLSKIFTEKQIDIKSMNSRINKQGMATVVMSFDVTSIEDLNQLINRLSAIDGVVDIQRSAG